MGEGEREEEGKGGAAPSLLQFGLLSCGGHATPMWAGVRPSYGPYGSSPGGGGPVTPPVCRYVPDTFWNTSGVRMLPSNISIFKCRPFGDSSSCL